jgi:N utilization substance protein B
MTRHNIREAIFLILFRAEFYPAEEVKDQIKLFMRLLEDENEAKKDGPISKLTKAAEEDPYSRFVSASQEEKDYITAKAENIIDQLDHVDIILSEASEGWSLRRIGKAELAILRLAVYEIKYDAEIPFKVAVNEAVELAKKYCAPEAASFVNGVLARIEE